MRTLLICFVGATIFGGCGGATTAPANTVLSPPADDKTKIEGFLKEYGINNPVAAVRDNGEYWHVSVSPLPSAAGNAPGETPKIATGGPAPEYKVYKDGRVHDSFSDKPLKKK